MRFRPLLLLGCALLAARPCGVDAQPDPGRVDASIAKSVAYLCSQQRADGAVADAKNETAMTALAVLALAACGHQPGDASPEGATLRKAITFLLRDDRQEPNGYFGQADGSRMYGHGIVTLCLAELLGMGEDEDQDTLMRRRLRKALDLIVAAQAVEKGPKHAGGWRYTPEAGDSDLSVTIWQLMALRSAQNAGVDIPTVAIDQAIVYLKRCYTTSRSSTYGLFGGFAYQPGTPTMFASAAAGLLAMQVCGEYEAEEVIVTADWLKRLNPRYTERFFFYGAYYYAQGMFQRGPEHAARAGEVVARLLLDNQLEDGSYEPQDGQERNAGRVYSTSMAILSLSVRYHVLPIFQR
jgi:hypothetical protein